MTFKRETIAIAGAIVGANLTAFTLYPRPVQSSLDCPQPLQQIGARINDVRADLREAEDKALREYWGEESPYRRLVRPPTAEEAAAVAATAPIPYALARTQSHPAATGGLAPISGSDTSQTVPDVNAVHPGDPPQLVYVKTGRYPDGSMPDALPMEGY